MKKRMIIMLVLAGLVFGGVFGWKVFSRRMMMKYMAAGSNPPQTVSTIKAEKQEWQPEIKAAGTLRAVKGADLSSEVQGIVDGIFFESGDDVEEGKVLVILRGDDDAARLKMYEAAEQLAAVNLERSLKQLKAQAVSQATVDSDKATWDAARAQVEQQKAAMAKKTIRAPFAGHIGIRAVDVGQYLNPGTAIVTLQQLDPVYVDFFLPEQQLPLVQIGQKITAETDAYPGRAFEGEITALNAKVDTNTRNLMARASIKNPDRLLLPGMFARVTVAAGAPERLLTLPQTAITYNPYGNTVFVVEENGVDEKGAPRLAAKQKFVKTGATRGDQTAIVEGLAEGETVVTAGQLKLRNGSPITVNNAVQPANDADPKPKDR